VLWNEIEALRLRRPAGKVYRIVDLQMRLIQAEYSTLVAFEKRKAVN